MVVPKYDLVYPQTPQPDHLFLTSVCKYLNPRRLITTRVEIRGPEYVPVWVSLGIEVVSGQEFSPVREAVKAIVEQFLGALTGGFDRDGWPLDRPVEAAELLAVAARVSGVSKVTEVLLGTASAQTERVSLSGLQLPRLEGIEVQSDTAPVARRSAGRGERRRGRRSPRARAGNPGRVLGYKTVFGHD